jgi:hypothetical protein
MKPINKYAAKFISTASALSAVESPLFSTAKFYCPSTINSSYKNWSRNKERYNESALYVAALIGV